MRNVLLLAMLISGCSATPQECRKHWDSYVFKHWDSYAFNADTLMSMSKTMREHKNYCSFSQPYEIKHRTLATKKFHLEQEIRGLKKEVCPSQKKWLESWSIKKQKIESLIEELERKIDVVLERDKSFENFSITGQFVNWTQQEDIVVSSSVARTTYYKNEESDTLFAWGSFLIQDYPRKRQLREMGYVTDKGFLWVGNTIHFSNLFYLGNTRLFNSRIGYVQTPTFSFKPPTKKRKIWARMRSELDTLEKEMEVLKQRLKEGSSPPKKVVQLCEGWASPERKKLSHKLRILERQVGATKFCLKAKEAYLEWLRSRELKYQSCGQTLRE